MAFIFRAIKRLFTGGGADEVRRVGPRGGDWAEPARRGAGTRPRAVFYFARRRPRATGLTKAASPPAALTTGEGRRRARAQHERPLRRKARRRSGTFFLAEFLSSLLGACSAVLQSVRPCLSFPSDKFHREAPVMQSAGYSNAGGVQGLGWVAKGPAPGAREGLFFHQERAGRSLVFFRRPAPLLGGLFSREGGDCFSFSRANFF